MNDLQAEIDVWLRSSAQNRWVPADEICARFQIRDRMLRADKKRPGLLDDFAVSSSQPKNNGFKHHCHLPTEQWLPIKHKMRRHAIGELRKVGRWDRGRTNTLTTNRPPAPASPVYFERHTGQGRFFP